MAAQELEMAATNYAFEAIQMDQQGSRGMAISNYQRAVELLLKLVQLNPSTP